jgi:HSP20 family molecular chaperone IbpA
LAGVYAEDNDNDFKGNTHYISGCRKDRSCAVGMSYHQMEITYSTFEKTLKFPASIEGAKVEHNFDNGLLIIHLKKAS